MTIEELKALEGAATPVGEGWGWFQHFPEFTWHLGGDKYQYRKGIDIPIADVRSGYDARLIATLRNLVPEILALVEAAQYLEPVDYDEDLARRVGPAIEAFNAKLEQL